MLQCTFVVEVVWENLLKAVEAEIWPNSKCVVFLPSKYLYLLYNHACRRSA